MTQHDQPSHELNRHRRQPPGPTSRPTSRPSITPASARRIRNYFLTGLVVAGPLAITVWLTWSFITWVDDLVRPFIPVAYRPGNLSARQDPRHRPRHRVRRADAARLPHREPGRPHPGRGRRAAARPHAAGALDLQGPQAGVRDAVLAIRLELPHRRPGRVSRARHVVAGVPVAAAEHGDHGAPAEPGRARLGVHAVHAQPHHRLLLLRAAQRP